MTRSRACLLGTLMALVFAAAVSASLLTIPVQVTDSLIPLLQAQAAPSWRAAVMSSADSAGYLRPLRIAQIQWLYDVSAGHYFFAYKSVHVALVLLAVGLFTRAVGARTRAGVCALALGLTVLTGLHTFLGTVWEAYPINHFLEVVVACLLVHALAESRGGWWADVAAALVFAGAALTLESGLLVWVVAVVAWCTGARGLSPRGLAVLTLLLVGYLILRFGYFSTGLPTLVERSTGFGTVKLDPAELTRRFGEHPMVLYGYNVLSSAGSVLLSQPRAGVWTLVAERHEGGLSAATVMNVAVSLLTTVALAAWSIRRWSVWRARRFEAADRAVLLALALVLGNAVLSYGYTKDEIMSPAGVFYALAVALAAREWFERRWTEDPVAVTAAPGRLATVLLVALATGGWAVRAVGLHYQMHQMAHDVRNEWVGVDAWLERQHAAPTTPEGRALVTALREDALSRVAGNPWGLALQGTRVFR